MRKWQVLTGERTDFFSFLLSSNNVPIGDERNQIDERISTKEETTMVSTNVKYLFKDIIWSGQNYYQSIKWRKEKYRIEDKTIVLFSAEVMKLFGLCLTLRFTCHHRNSSMFDSNFIEVEKKHITLIICFLYWRFSRRPLSTDYWCLMGKDNLIGIEIVCIHTF